MKNKISFVFIFSLFLATSVFSAPILKVEPATQNIYTDQKATIKVTTTNATTCTITGGRYNKSKIQTNGNTLLTVDATTNYITNCTDAAGEVASSTVKVVLINKKTGTEVTNSGTGGTGNTGTTGGGTGSTSGGGNKPSLPQIQYGNQTTQTEADNICKAYSNYQSVYGTPTIGGGGSVPVDLTQLRPVLESIDQNTRLSANELRQSDLIKWCRILPNVAAASAKLANEASKQLKTIADECTADSRCYLNRAYKYDVENEIKYASTLPVLGHDVAKMLKNVSFTPPDPTNYIDMDIQQKCVSEWKKGRHPISCWGVPTERDVVDTAYYAARNRIMLNQSSLASEFASGGGIIGSRKCLKTFSGSDPTNVYYKDADCADYKVQPAIINQEVLKQITALPYTQAYSPAAELGVDQNINNLNTRIREGNLIDQDISSNFGSVKSGGTNPLGSGGGNIVNGTDMKTVEPNYKQILVNIGVIATLYDVTKAGLASSTSACKFLPVETRKLAIQNIESAKKTYTDYAAELTKKWEAAVKTPKENHLDLVTQINFDLKDKYNQATIGKVKDAVMALLKTCVDAKK